MRCSLDFLFRDASDFLKFLHQFCLRLQATGRVDDDDIGTDLRCFFDGLERNASGIGSALARDNFTTDALGPNGQLLDRRGGGMYHRHPA